MGARLNRGSQLQKVQKSHQVCEDDTKKATRAKKKTRRAISCLSKMLEKILRWRQRNLRQAICIQHLQSLPSVLRRKSSYQQEIPVTSLKALSAMKRCEKPEGGLNASMPKNLRKRTWMSSVQQAGPGKRAGDKNSKASESWRQVRARQLQNIPSVLRNWRWSGYQKEDPVHQPQSSPRKEAESSLGNKRKWDATLQKHAKSASELLCKAIASQREKLLSHNW